MKRVDLWKKIIEKEGYKIIYQKNGYWDFVPYAVKGDEKIPLSITQTRHNCLSLITTRNIIASQRNFHVLKKFTLENQKEPLYNIRIQWLGKNSCNLILEKI